MAPLNSDHLRPLATAESATSNVPFAPTVSFVAALAPVAAARSPLASQMVSLATVVDVPAGG